MRTSVITFQRYHFGHNAETYWLIGQTMATGMLKMMQHIS